MITYEVPEFETQPTIGQVVNVYDPAVKAVVAAKITGEPVWGYNGTDDCNYASYPLEPVDQVNPKAVAPGHGGQVNKLRYAAQLG